jgi:transketolase
MRPADGNEIAEAWRFIMESKKHPVALILSRQPLPTIDRSHYSSASGLRKGGYIVSESDGKPDIILLATGSEVGLCLDAQDKLKGQGVKARVVSMPSFELYESQPLAYRQSVLPSDCRKRLAVEMASSLGWRRYVGIPPDGAVIALRHFGASAPWKELQKKFGFTADDVVKKAKDLLAGKVIDR